VINVQNHDRMDQPGELSRFRQDFYDCRRRSRADIELNMVTMNRGFDSSADLGLLTPDPQVTFG
jgi:hypothetical protein